MSQDAKATGIEIGKIRHIDRKIKQENNYG